MVEDEEEGSSIHEQPEESELAMAEGDEEGVTSSEGEHRAAVLAKMTKLPEVKEKIEIVSRAQYVQLPKNAFKAQSPICVSVQPFFF